MTVSNIKAHCMGTIIKVWVLVEGQTHKSMQQNRKLRNRATQIHSVDFFDKGAKPSNRGQSFYFKNDKILETEQISGYQELRMGVGATWMIFVVELLS